MPAIQDVTTKPTQRLVSKSDVLNKFIASLEDFAEKQQRAGMLSSLEEGFSRFARSQGREVLGQRKILVDGNNQLLEQQLSSSVRILDQTTRDSTENINSLALHLGESQEQFIESYNQLIALIKALPLAERTELLAELNQSLVDRNIPNEHITSLRAAITREIAPRKSNLDAAFVEYRAWRCCSQAAKSLELREESEKLSENTLSDREVRKALGVYARKLLRRLPEKRQRQYIHLARKAHKSIFSGTDLEEDSIFSSSSLGIEIDLDEIIPNFSNDAIDVEQSPSAEVEQDFRTFLEALAEEKRSLEFNEVTAEVRGLLDSKLELNRMQQQVVDTFFEQLKPRQKRRCIVEAQKRLDRYHQDSLRTFDHGRPVESRFPELIDGVEFKARPSDDPFYGLELEMGGELEPEPSQEEPVLPKRLQARFDAMVSELEKLHRLETIVIATADTAERDRVKVYRGAAAEIKELLEVRNRSELLASFNDQSSFQLKINHLDPMFGASHQQLDEEIQQFYAYLGGAKLEDYSVSKAEILVESGRINDGLSSIAQQVVGSIPSRQEVIDYVSKASSLPESGGIALVKGLSSLLGRKDSGLAIGSANQPDVKLDTLSMPKPNLALDIPKLADEEFSAEIKKVNDTFLDYESLDEANRRDTLLYDTQRNMAEMKRYLEGYADRQVIEEFRVELLAGVELEDKDEYVRNLRSLAEANLVMIEQKERGEEVELSREEKCRLDFAHLVLTSFESPDFKHFGANYSRLGDLLEEQSKSEENFDPQELIDCEISAMPTELTSVYAKFQDSYLRVPTIELDSSKRSYGEHSLEELKSDFRKILLAASSIISKKRVETN